MSVIYLIRHAQASFGGEEYDRLSSLGAEQAAVLGDHFKRAGIRFDAIYSGSLARQTETARIAMGRLSDKEDSVARLRLNEAFNEYDASKIIRSTAPDLMREDPLFLEALGKVYKDRRSFQLVFERAMLRWVGLKGTTAGVESWPGFVLRVRKGIEAVMRENGPKKRIALFTSGGVISAVVKMVLGLSDSRAIQLAWQIRNASVSICKYSEGRLGLSSFNAFAHLEFQERPELLTYR